MKGNVWVIEGTWIAMSNDNMTSLFPSRKVARKPPWKRKKCGRNWHLIFSVAEEWSGKMTALKGSTYWITSFPWSIHCLTHTNVWFITSLFGCLYVCIMNLRLSYANHELLYISSLVVKRRKCKHITLLTYYTVNLTYYTVNLSYYTVNILHC